MMINNVFSEGFIVIKMHYVPVVLLTSVTLENVLNHFDDSKTFYYHSKHHGSSLSPNLKP